MEDFTQPFMQEAEIGSSPDWQTELPISLVTAQILQSSSLRQTASVPNSLPIKKQVWSLHIITCLTFLSKGKLTTTRANLRLTLHT